MTSQCIPVVFIHSGQIPRYLLVADEIAKEQGNNCVILSDSDISKYCDKGFEEKYRYISNRNDQSSAVRFERFCTQRWFILNNWMKATGTGWCFYCDSDVLLFCDVSKELNHENVVNICAQDTTANDAIIAFSGHSSFWNTSELSGFCNFVMDVYTGDNRVLREIKETQLSSGGCMYHVSDMSLLYYYYRNRPYKSLLKVENEACFDDNINASDNFLRGQNEMAMDTDGRKAVVSKNGWLFFTRRTDGSHIRAMSLHLQGGSKLHYGRYRVTK